jgi:hypothetical protein
MIEPEMAFADINDDMQCAEDYVRYCCQHLLDNCMEVRGELSLSLSLSAFHFAFYTTSMVGGNEEKPRTLRLHLFICCAYL